METEKTIDEQIVALKDNNIKIKELKKKLRQMNWEIMKKKVYLVWQDCIISYYKVRLWWVSQR